jgi:tetratricopeptide (TPR) repeat protein
MKISTNGAKIHNNLGIFYRKLGRLDEAISQYKKALSINPDYPGAHYNLGLMYGGKGFFSLAADHLYKAGVLFLQQGDGKGALKSFEGLKQTKSKELEQTLFEKLYSREAGEVNL